MAIYKRSEIEGKNVDVLSCRFVCPKCKRELLSSSESEICEDCKCKMDKKSCSIEK